MREFVWTGTYDEARARFDELGSEYLKICQQLGAWRPTTWVPQTDFDDYRSWKSRALGAQEGIRRERQALKAWLKANAPAGIQPNDSFTHKLAAKLDELDIDYTADQLENLRRRVMAEMRINRHALLVLDLIEMFRDHDPCGKDCDACALLDRAEREVA